MKKILSLVLASAMIAILFASCGAKPEALTLDHLKVTAVHITSTDQELDTVTFVEAFNAAEVTGKANTTNLTGDVIVFACTNEEVVSVTVVGENKFVASGSNIETPYKFKSEQLYTLYTAATGK